MNFGIIDKLKSTLNSSTLIATIHNSLKDEDKFGIPAGSIGTALEKFAYITFAIKKAENNRHLVFFKNTKAEFIESTNNNYFFLQVEEIDNKVKITGLADSNGEIFKKRKGNTKVDTDEFNNYLLLSVPTRFIRDWITSRYLDQILQIIRLYKKDIIRIEFKIDDKNTNQNLDLNQAIYF